MGSEMCIRDSDKAGRSGESVPVPVSVPDPFRSDSFEPCFSCAECFPLLLLLLRTFACDALPTVLSIVVDERVTLSFCASCMLEAGALSRLSFGRVL